MYRFLLLSVLGFLLNHGAAAPLETVTTAQDRAPIFGGAQKTFREALRDVSVGGLVSFDPSLRGQTFHLTQGRLEITKSCTIDAGVVPGGVRVQNTTDRVFAATANNSVVTIKALHIRGWLDNDLPGGGLFAGSGTDVRLDDCTFEDCRADGEAAVVNGGAIYTNGALEVRRCAFLNNQAKDGGGAIAVVGIETSFVARNCLFLGNELTSASPFWGGAAIFGSGGGPLNIAHGTFVENDAKNGDAVILNTNGLTVLGHTIFVNNDSAIFQSTAGTGVSVGYNLADDDGFGFEIASDRTHTFTDLEALGFYGGRTQSMPPTPTSVAVDSGDPTYSSEPLDQRGFARVTDGDDDGAARVDIGSVERGGRVLVTSRLDEDDDTLTGSVSLREAVTLAPPGSRIRFAEFMAGAEILLTRELDLSKTLDIDARDLCQGIRLFAQNAPGSGLNQRLLRVSAPQEVVSLSGFFLVNGELASSGSGGGIWVTQSTRQLHLRDCTLAFCQSASGGGALHVDAGSSVLAENVTFTRNRGHRGGAIESAGDVDVRFCTFAFNEAISSVFPGTVALDSGASFKTTASAYQSAPWPAFGFDPADTSIHPNTGGDNAVPWLQAPLLPVINDQAHEDLGLLPLAYHLGHVPVHRIRKDSPLVDEVRRNGASLTPDLDARGWPRPIRVTNSFPASRDIGAYEREAEVVVDTLLDEDDEPSENGLTLREAVGNFSKARITFDPALSGQTLTLTEGPISLANVLLDGSDLPSALTIRGEAGGDGLFSLSGPRQVGMLIRGLRLAHTDDTVIQLEGTGPSCLQIDHCLFEMNDSAILSGGNAVSLRLLNNTFSGNAIPSSGLLRFTSGSRPYLYHNTFSENTGTGPVIDFGNGAQGWFAANLFQDSPVPVRASGGSQLQSLGGHVSKTASGTLNDPSDTIAPAMVTLTLANNGGPTQTHALPFGHPAQQHLAGPFRGIVTDQRGISRSGNIVSSGAFEASPAQPSFTLWQQVHLPLGAPGGPNGDVHNDGVTNLFRYASGHDASASPPLVDGELQSVNGRLEVRFARSPLVSDVRFVVETSVDLSDWDIVYQRDLDHSFTLEDAVIDEVPRADGTTGVTIQSLLSADDHDRLMMRVRLEWAP